MVESRNWTRLQLIAGNTMKSSTLRGSPHSTPKHDNAYQAGVIKQH
jgi:hypothetical protein